MHAWYTDDKKSNKKMRIKEKKRKMWHPWWKWKSALKEILEIRKETYAGNLSYIEKGN